MARPRASHIENLTQKLRLRLQTGVYRPGQKFASAREIAASFGVSYQSAHRILTELCAEGLLERRAASGTYLPGGIVDYKGVQLVFSARAQVDLSFGARLLGDLCARLDAERISWKLAFVSPNSEAAPRVSLTRFPVLWEAPDALREVGEGKRAALLLNDRPPPGLEAAFIDSVSIDDFSGGASAAQILLANHPKPGRFAVLSGPDGDARNRARRDGFLSVCPRAKVVAAGSWYFEAGLTAAPDALQSGPDGVFCCNDRLAAALRHFCAQNAVKIPPIVGFDDAPVAESLDLTTIALPWDDIVAGALESIKNRLSGGGGAARQLILTPLPVRRGI